MGLKFPLGYGQSYCDTTVARKIQVSMDDQVIPIDLTFAPYQSLLFKLDKNGQVSFINIGFLPKTPVVIPRIKQGKERWQVE